MKSIFKIIILIAIFTLIYGCTPQYVKYYNIAKEKYNYGDFEGAMTNCIASLQVNPDYIEAMDLLEVSYEKGIEKKERSIRDLKSRRAPFYWDDVYKSYYQIIQLNQSLLNSNINLRDYLKSKINAIDDESYIGIEEAKNQAAEQHYIKGLELKKFPDVDNQKNCAKHFSQSLHYIPGYRNAQELYNECKANAIKRIAIIPFEDLSNKRGKYGSVSDVLVDNITSFLFNDKKASEFIELITREQLENVIREQSYNRSELFDPTTAVKLGKLLNVHEIIVGKISQIIYTPERLTTRTITEKTNAQVGTKIEYDKKGRAMEVPRYGEIYAVVTINKKTAKAQINGSYKIIDVETGKIKNTESCSTFDEFNYEWARYRGNEEALSYESRNLCGKDEEFPNEDNLVNNALNKLSMQLYQKISSYTK